MEKLYPLQEWCRDIDFWHSRGPLSPRDFPEVEAYFQRVQAENPDREGNCRRMWMALAFLQSHLPQLVEAGAAPSGPAQAALLPPSLATALYRAFMSPVAAANPRGITVPLILEVVKQQKDWNEDRT